MYNRRNVFINKYEKKLNEYKVNKDPDSITYISNDNQTRIITFGVLVSIVLVISGYVFKFGDTNTITVASGLFFLSIIIPFMNGSLVEYLETISRERFLESLGENGRKKLASEINEYIISKNNINKSSRLNNILNEQKENLLSDDKEMQMDAIEFLFSDKSFSLNELEKNTQASNKTSRSKSEIAKSPIDSIFLIGNKLENFVFPNLK